MQVPRPPRKHLPLPGHKCLQHNLGDECPKQELLCVCVWWGDSNGSSSAWIHTHLTKEYLGLVRMFTWWLDTPQSFLNLWQCRRLRMPFQFFGHVLVEAWSVEMRIMPLSIHNFLLEGHMWLVKYEHERFHPNLEDCIREGKKRRERGREERETEDVSLILTTQT